MSGGDKHYETSKRQDEGQELESYSDAVRLTGSLGISGGGAAMGLWGEDTRWERGRCHGTDGLQPRSSRGVVSEVHREGTPIPIVPAMVQGHHQGILKSQSPSLSS